MRTSRKYLIEIFVWAAVILFIIWILERAEDIDERQNPPPALPRERKL